jgi:hypothetical protein
MKGYFEKLKGQVCKSKWKEKIKNKKVLGTKPGVRKLQG